VLLWQSTATATEGVPAQYDLPDHATKLGRGANAGRAINELTSMKPLNAAFSGATTPPVLLQPDGKPERRSLAYASSFQPRQPPLVPDDASSLRGAVKSGGAIFIVRIHYFQPPDKAHPPSTHMRLRRPHIA
jgi:hypothetical protein